MKNRKKHRQNSNLIIHCPTSEGVSEVSGASKQANKQASGPVLQSLFLVILALSALAFLCNLDSHNFFPTIAFLIQNDHVTVKDLIMNSKPQKNLLLNRKMSQQWLTFYHILTTTLDTRLSVPIMPCIPTSALT